MPSVRFFLSQMGLLSTEQVQMIQHGEKGKQHKKQKFLSKVQLFICSEIINNSKSVAHYKEKEFWVYLKSKK